MPRLIVRAQAEAELDQIVASIAKDNLQAALRFHDRAQETFELIARWPQSGTRRIVRDASLQGLRSYPMKGHRTYLVFYLPLEDGAEIVHFIHGARDIPSALRSS